jgi:hypothetical protein
LQQGVRGLREGQLRWGCLNRTTSPVKPAPPRRRARPRGAPRTAVPGSATGPAVVERVGRGHVLGWLAVKPAGRMGAARRDSGGTSTAARGPARAARGSGCQGGLWGFRLALGEMCAGGNPKTSLPRFIKPPLSRHPTTTQSNPKRPTPAAKQAGTGQAEPAPHLAARQPARARQQGGREQRRRGLRRRGGPQLAPPRGLVLGLAVAWSQSV